jgi:CheY-like chemotaxis protein
VITNFSNQNKQILHGLRVLLVEDEPLIALALEDELRDLGCEVVGPAFSLAAAVQLAGDATLNGAILDVNLGGQKVYPAADLLAARNLPFIFVTGYGAAGLLEPYRDRPVLQKPIALKRLVEILSHWL